MMNGLARELIFDPKENEMERMWKGLIAVAMAAALAGCATATGQEQAEDGAAEAVEVEEEAQSAQGEMVAQADEAERQGQDAEEEYRLDTSGLEEARREGVLAHTQLWSEEGFGAQFRMELAKAHSEDSEYSDPGTTGWTESERELPEELGADGEGYRSPGMVLNRVEEAMRFDQGLGTELWEQTQRVRMDGEGEARGIILRWGMKDDAMMGSDLRVRMEEGEDGWYATKLEERWHCMRGVTDDGLCM